MGRSLHDGPAPFTADAFSFIQEVGQRRSGK